jgi:hypothetical protein
MNMENKDTRVSQDGLSREKKRIPYNQRVNSQLSVAKYYWWIVIQWVKYELDYENCKKEERDWETFYYPDLVEA